MKLGRKKPPSAPSSSSRASFISHVFPTSWLSKFKHMSIHTKPDPRKVKRKGKQNSSPVGSRQSCAGGNGGRFYGGDDDGAFWRLSFGEESANGEKINGGVLRSVWYESDDELDVLSSRGCGSRCPKLEEGEEARKVNKLPKGVEISMDMHTSNKEKKTESRAPRRRTQKDWKLRRMDRQVMEEQLLELGRRSYEAERESTESGENEASKIEPPRPISTTKRDNCKFARSSSRKNSSEPCLNSKNSSFRTITDDGGFTTKNLEETEGFSTENLDSECQNLKEMKTEKLRSKTVQERKSLHVSRESQRRRAKKYSKVRAYSPRTPSKVEIKALEDIRKSKMKMKKKVKEGTSEEGGAGLDRFAVVKCSSNPQQDFRDSMLEMIMEKRMRRPEELEELLACYLTLNSDEYHDLIIKVFRQVWFDLDHSCFYTELRSEDCCCG